MVVVNSRGKVFNGTTVELTGGTGAGTYALLNYTGSDSVTAVDDKDGAVGTNNADDIDFVEPGSKNYQVSLTIAGTRNIIAGQKYDVTIKGPDGTVLDDYGNMLCTSSSSSGSHNGEFQQSITLQPTRTLTAPWAAT